MYMHTYIHLEHFIFYKQCVIMVDGEGLGPEFLVSVSKLRNLGNSLHLCALVPSFVKKNNNST